MEFAGIGHDCNGVITKEEDVTLFAPCSYSDRILGTCPINPEAFTGYVLNGSGCEELCATWVGLLSGVDFFSRSLPSSSCS